MGISIQMMVFPFEIYFIRTDSMHSPQLIRTTSLLKDLTMLSKLHPFVKL